MPLIACNDPLRKERVRIRDMAMEAQAIGWRIAGERMTREEMFDKSHRLLGLAVGLMGAAVAGALRETPAPKS